MSGSRSRACWLAVCVPRCNGLAVRQGVRFCATNWLAPDLALPGPSAVFEASCRVTVVEAHQQKLWKPHAGISRMFERTPKILTNAALMMCLPWLARLVLHIYRRLVV